MNDFRADAARLPLLLTALFLTAWGTLAQTLPSDVLRTNEILTASSPYGEATAIRNIAYVPHPTPRQNFDLYLPRDQHGQPFPLVFWIHGGAWMMGSKDWINVKYLVRHGYAIATIDYRFTPENTFPAQIQDCNAALNFILAQATNYGINPNRFVVGGGSAGGHLALLLGLARQERAFGADPAIKPIAILDFFGPADLNQMRGDLEAIHSEKGLELFNDAGTKLLGVPVVHPSDTAKTASPITYVSAASPPVLMLHGDKDDSVPVAQSRRLHDSLDRAGVNNQLILLENVGHDGPLFSTPEMESKVIRFLNEALLNSSNPTTNTRGQ